MTGDSTGRDAGRAASGEPGAQAPNTPAEDTATELTLMARVERRRVRRHRHRVVLLADATAAPPTRWREQFGGVYRLLLNKYYVDELYDAAIVQPIKLLSTGVLWKGVDAGVIDGAVNGVGALVRVGSARPARGCRPARCATYAAVAVPRRRR